MPEGQTGANLDRSRYLLWERRLGFGLSRELWLVQIGIFLNILGYGAVLPFEVLYLHDGRGFSLGVAGLVVGTIPGVAIVSAPLTGPLIDRLGSRSTAVAGGVALALGYIGLALAASPVFAFAAAALAGTGSGALNPSQAALVATLAPTDAQHRATAVSRVATNSGYVLGGALGGLVAGLGASGLRSLFLANAATYLVYVTILVALVRNPRRVEPLRGGYRLVLRDRAFVRLGLTNVAIISVGWGVFSWVFPYYARKSAGLTPQLVGLLLAANAAAVVLAQVPVAKLAEGRRRVVMMALAAAIFAAACMLTVSGSVFRWTAVPALFLASIAVGLGECFHTSSLMPLVADLAPPGLRGRYMGAIGLTWQIGLAVGPAMGVQVLAVWPAGAFIVGAGVVVAAGISVLSLEGALPESVRLTPRPSSGPAG